MIFLSRYEILFNYSLLLEWQKQKQKRLRIAGKEHISTKGKLVPEKKPGPDCNCRRKCYQKVPEAVRLKTFEGFYSMKTHDEQNAYLFGLMRQIDIKRKRKKDSIRRTCTFEYFIRVRGRETQVCQTAFKNIHAITDRKVRVLCKKMDDGIMFPSDNRGKNSGSRAGEVRLSSEIIEQIKNHIYSVIHTHKLKDFIRYDKITGTEVNISKMWKDYIREYDPNNLNTILNKGKKNVISEPQEEIQQYVIQNPQKDDYIHTVENQSDAFVTYPGSGHLINIAENYFAQSITPFQPQQINYIQTTDKLGYYQQTPVVVQQTQQIIHANTVVNAANTLQNPHNQQNTFVIMQPLQTTQPATIKINSPMTQTKKKDNKKGPLVKQWRYTNIFHEEINGAALAAIKTRLNMYYTTKEDDKKKFKQVPKLQQPIQVQIINPQRSNANEFIAMLARPSQDSHE